MKKNVSIARKGSFQGKNFSFLPEGAFSGAGGWEEKAPQGYINEKIWGSDRFESDMHNTGAIRVDETAGQTVAADSGLADDLQSVSKGVASGEGRCHRCRHG